MNLVSLFKPAAAAALIIALFFTINPADLIAALSSVDIHDLFIAFIVGFVGFIMTSALRWQMVLSKLYRIAIPYRLALRYYWEGLFAGYFVPGGIGADIYRALAAGRRTANLQKNIVCVTGEKIYILVDSIIFVLVLLPLVQNRIHNPLMLETIGGYLWQGGAALLVIILVLCLLFRLRKTCVLSGLSAWFMRLADQSLRRIPGFSASLSSEESLAGLIKPFTRPSSIILLFIFTLLNRTMLCVGGYFLLKSIDSSLPLLINFFIWTAMTILFSLPISIGTVGVREWLHILLLGLFGISAESALAVSFVGLGCLWLSTLMGGLIFLADSIRRGKT